MIQSTIFDQKVIQIIYSLTLMKIMTRRKAVPTTEYPMAGYYSAIGKISVKAPAFPFQILFIVWVVWIVMKWIVLEDNFIVLVTSNWYNQ